MRIINFVVRLFTFVFVLAISMLFAIGIHSVITYQADDEYAEIHFPSKEDNVSYIDSGIFWVDNIKNNVTDIDLLNSKLRVANWFGWSWWKTSMSKVDLYFVDVIVSVAKPVIFPIASADEIKTYYNTDILDFVDYIERDKDTVDDFISMSRRYFDVSITNALDENGNPIREKIDTTVLEQNKDKYALSVLLENDVNENGLKDIYDVADEYNYFYQLFFKLHKYNVTDENGNFVYAKWYNKFIFEDASGRHIKSAVYSVYMLELLALAFSIFFMTQTPSMIDVDNDGVIQYKPSLHGFKRKKKKSKNNE